MNYRGEGSDGYKSHMSGARWRPAGEHLMPRERGGHGNAVSISYR